MLPALAAPALGHVLGGAGGSDHIQPWPQHCVDAIGWALLVWVAWRAVRLARRGG